MQSQDTKIDYRDLKKEKEDESLSEKTSRFSTFFFFSLSRTQKIEIGIFVFVFLSIIGVLSFYFLTTHKETAEQLYAPPAEEASYE